MIERKGLTRPERVNKVISCEKLGSISFPQTTPEDRWVQNICSCREGCDTPGFYLTDAGSHYLATHSDSASLENLANLADHSLASENDAKDIQAGVSEIQVSESAKLIGLLEDLSRRQQRKNTIVISSPLKTANTNKQLYQK